MYTKKRIILDFDGTIFRLFTNYNLKKIVIELSEMFKQYDIFFDTNCDSFDAFKVALNADNKIRTEILFRVNKIITTAEIDAINSGILVPGFLDFMKFANDEGFLVSIVSNNSKECIDEFFKKYCSNFKVPIIGRIWDKPQYMKPHTYLLESMCKTLHVSNEDIIFIGDNPRDFECAAKFNCDFIGLTPTNSKRNRMVEYTSDILIIDDFYQLIDYLKK